MRKNLKAYQSVNIKSTLATAEPHQIISMMYNGILESLAQAKGAIERRDLEKKSQQLTKATNILQALTTSLDSESQPEISKNFSELYSFCIAKINDASLSLDISIIDQVINFLSPLRDAWQQMPEESKQEGHDLLKKKEQTQDNVIGA
jgi:flagellar protein FliS